jgi:hypothetical protein
MAKNSVSRPLFNLLDSKLRVSQQVAQAFGLLGKKLVD